MNRECREIENKKPSSTFWWLIFSVSLPFFERFKEMFFKYSPLADLRGRGSKSTETIKIELEQVNFYLGIL